MTATTNIEENGQNLCRVFIQIETQTVNLPGELNIINPVNCKKINTQGALGEDYFCKIVNKQ